MVKYLISLIIVLTFVGCTTSEAPTYNVRLVADGREQHWQVDEPITVQEFLDRPEVEVELGPLDRMVPEPWTQIYNDIRITIRRVSEETYCETAEIPFERRTDIVEGLTEEQIAQIGENGIEEVCYRVRIEDGQRLDPVLTSRTIQSAPIDEVVLVGPSEELEPVPISGTLAYLNNGNAWMIRGNSTNKTPLSVEGDLDGRVFDLDTAATRLIYSRYDLSGTSEGNTLWFIPNVNVDLPDTLQLGPQDVIYAEWVPSQENVISYSTFEPQDISPGWRALNDLSSIRIDPNTGETIRLDEILTNASGGPYSWWGTDFEWSPDGNRLAWIRADGIGLVDIESGTLGEYLIKYTELTPSIGDWSWRASVSWSPDGSLITTTTHGPPIGSEPPSSSPVFDVSVTATDGSFSTNIVEKAGIWSEPLFSPEIIASGNTFPQGYLAYFQAREWENSISGDYDLIIADRDGSNKRRIFPPSTTQPGLEDEDLQDVTWSPDGRQLAFIYQGNLWVVDAETELAYQLTQGGGTSHPIWRQ